MKKKSKLLHVMSIIFIVFACLGILSETFMILTYSAVSEMMQSMNLPMMPVGYYTFALICSCVELAAGILGVMYRSRKSVVIIGCVYCLLIIGSLLYSVITFGFSITYAFSLIIPALYMWGIYQSQ